MTRGVDNHINDLKETHKEKERREHGVCINETTMNEQIKGLLLLLVVQIWNYDEFILLLIVSSGCGSSDGLLLL